MELKFIKLSHQQYQLICTVDSVEVCNKVLEAKSLLRHDLMHYCVETVAKLENSFYGDMKGNTIVDRDEIMITERVVVILQKLDIDQNYNPANYYKLISNSFTYQDSIPPAYLTYAFVEDVGNMYMSLINKYNNLKTGIDNQLILNF